VALLGVAALPFLAACGDDGDASAASSQRSTTTDRGSSSLNKGSTTTGGTTTAPSTTAPLSTSTTTGGGDVQATITLTIEVTADGPLRSGTLSCGPGGASGTGHLADPAAAQAACTLLQGDEGVRDRLLHGPDPDRMCTMQYGGPEVARVTGQIDGQQVDATLDRTDGCGISEWQAATALVGPAET
jgi:subtilisin inhibitor-like